MMKRSLGKQYGVLVAAGISLVCLCLVLVNLYILSSYNDRNQRDITIALDQGLTNQLQHDALLLAESLAGQLKEPVKNHDIRKIYQVLHAANRNKDIGYTYVYDLHGNVIHDGTITLYHYGKPVSALLPAGLQASFNTSSQRIGRNIHTSVAITDGQRPIAGLRLSMAYNQAALDLQQLQSTLKNQYQQDTRNLIISLLAVSGCLLLMAIPLVMQFSRRLTRPLEELAHKCQLADKGEKVQFALPRQDELGQVAHTLDNFYHRLQQNREQIDNLADLDPLTQLSNRRMFSEELEQLIHWAQHEQRQFALLFIDLDDFKQINDSAGHEVGDLLLQQVAARLTLLVQQNSDHHSFPLPNKLLLARLGGDEFVTIVPSFDNVEEISELAADIIATLEPHFVIEEEQYSISASIGITLFPDDGENASELLKHSDIAMYAAKNAGRNRFRFFEAKMNRSVLEKQLVQQGVKAALSEQQFQLLYQPIFDLQSRCIIGAEAVIRWQHPTHGELSPANFIPLIEKTDQIVPVTLWVLEHACRDLNQQFLPLKPDFKLSINISGAAFLKTPVSANIPLLINTHHLPGSALHLELTETSMMADFEACRQVILDWKALGVNVWIDDFGTGYSSLSYLHRLPIDGLKIDQSFVADLDSNDSRRIVDTIITLARTLNLDTVSEGIESEQDLQRLQQMGNRYGQGYHLSKPLSADALKQLLMDGASPGCLAEH